MPDTFTPTLNLTRVGINESDDTWGTKLNANSDKIDAGVAADRTRMTALEARCALLETEAAKASFIGEIRIYNGSVASIASLPGGVWKLCDGNNGTPNLVGRFVAGGGTVAGTIPGTTGGLVSWTGNVAWRVASGLRAIGSVLTWGQMPAHNHGGRTNDDGYHSHNYNAVMGNPSGGPGSFSNVWGPQDRQTDGAGIHGHDFATSTAGNNEAHDHALPDLSHDHSVTVPTLPPFYALCYVMRVA